MDLGCFVSKLAAGGGAFDVLRAAARCHWGSFRAPAERLDVMMITDLLCFAISMYMRGPEPLLCYRLEIKMCCHN